MRQAVRYFNGLLEANLSLSSATILPEFAEHLNRRP